MSHTAGVLVLLLAHLAAAQAGPMPIVGAGRCPRPEEVSARVDRLLDAQPTGEIGSGAERVRLEEEPGALVLWLESAAGTALDRRVIEGGAACGERADAAALVVMAWRVRLRDSPVLPTTPPPAAAAPPAPRPTRAPPILPRLAWEAGVAFVASLAGTDFAPAGRAHLELSRRGSIAAARLEIFGAGRREIALGLGSARWTRIGVALGPSLRLAARRARFDLHAAALLAASVLEGSGFASTSSAVVFAPGLSAGLSVGVKLGPVTPFLDLSVAGWPREEIVETSGPAPVAASLARWEVLLGLGLAAGTF